MKLPLFVTNFLGALDNTVFGHSLKKWLAVGVFWVLTFITIKFTNKDNLAVVLGILSGLITALMGINTYANLANKDTTNSVTDAQTVSENSITTITSDPTATK